MSKYPTYKQLNLPEIQKAITDFWKENDTFNQSISQRSEDNAFVFYEGPPSANGMPGIHHVMGRTVKDLFCRFQSMKGKRVPRKGGWDTHGLPVELSVEKELGITKEDIGKSISIEDYNAKCRATVMKYKDKWDELTRVMGYWVDLDEPYVTFENNYIESVWHLLAKFHKQDLLYKGYTIQPYSPAAGTGLSTHELNQPGCYQDVTDTTVTAQFKTIEATLPQKLQGLGTIHILAWTTTPWTLPSNTALTVGPKISYVVVKSFNQYTHLPINVILAKKLVGKQFSGKFVAVETEEELQAYQAGDKKIPFLETIEITGSELVDIKYEQLLNYALPYQNPENAFRVISGDFVTTEDGTGIVHTAPTFGADDARVAKAAAPEVPPLLVLDDQSNPVPLVNLNGEFRAELPEIGGKYVKNEYYNEGEAPERSIDVEIAIKLKEENKAFKVEKYVHNYPHCWRTDKPILYYPLDSWFVRASSAKGRMKELNSTINWKPAHTGEKRFGNWLENLQDWNLSRSRYWGIPLPIWRTEEGDAEICIGSIEQLSNEIDKANEKLGLSQVVPEDLHRPFIDNITLVTDQGEPMTRELDLIDVWFDSGAMPYAQWHYPFENKELFEKNFPADFIAEGVDQTRGWFYTLHAIATMGFDSVAYKNVVSNGLVLDKKGVKMSKRLGNTIDPFKTIAENGADATRWYMISNASPWDNLKFDLDGIGEVKRKFFGTLYNTYSFFALYANIDGFTYEQDAVPLADRTEIDQWIISKLNSLINEVDLHYADYDATQAARKIQHFLDVHLSNWYVRLCRRRFWKGDYSADKIAAYQTLFECMMAISKMMAPVAPFFADWLFKNLNDHTNKESSNSVHLCDFPNSDSQKVNKALEERMDYAQRISSLVLSLRKKERLRVRQPLQKILLPVLNDTFQAQVEAVESLILAEVNIKEIEFLTDDAGIIKKRIKANFKTLGKKLGKNMKAAAAHIATLDQDAISEIEKNGSYPIQLDGTDYTLVLEDFEITSDDIPGWQVANDRDVTVALDITLTDALKAEGTAREIVNRIQNLRKNNDYKISDRINITISAEPRIEEAIGLYEDYIKNEVLGDVITIASNDGESIEIYDDLIVNMVLAIV